MSVVADIRDTGPCRKELTVRVPEPAVSAESERVVADMRRRARLPGFRKGKVPVDMVKKRFAEDIEHELIQRLVPRYWRQAAAEARLDPLLPPEMSDIELAAGSELTFRAVVEVRPEIELGSLDGFSLPAVAVGPTQEQIDQGIEQLRRETGSWRAVERGAARGDRVAAHSAEIGPDGEPGELQPVRFEVGDPRVWEELSLAVTGGTAGQEVDFDRAADDAPEAPRRRFRARIDTVEERELPELDDAFAARVTEGGTLADLRKRVGESLELAQREERRRQQEQAVLDQLVERNPVELPAGVVERERESLLGEYARSLAERGVNPEDPQIDWNELRTQAQPQAERRVHSRLLLDAAAEALGIEISEQEFEEALGRLARMQGVATMALRSQLDSDGRLAEFRGRLRRGRAMSRLLGEDEESGAGPGEPAPALRPDEG